MIAAIALSRCFVTGTLLYTSDARIGSSSSRCRRRNVGAVAPALLEHPIDQVRIVDRLRPAVVANAGEFGQACNAATLADLVAHFLGASRRDERIAFEIECPHRQEHQ